MNTGEHLWWIPVGDTPNRILGHPALQGIDIGNTGSGQQAAPARNSDPTLLYGQRQRRHALPLCREQDDRGERIGQVELSASGRYGMMTYMHEGRQHVVMQIEGGLVALALPDGPNPWLEDFRTTTLTRPESSPRKPTTDPCPRMPPSLGSESK